MSGQVRPRAVVFDLFNTLVPGGTRAQRDEVSHRMADVLAVDPESFADLVRRTFDDRTRGRLGGLSDTVASLAARLGASPDADAIQAAVELRLAMTRRLLEGTWALTGLAEIGGAGILRGLVSDCSAETPTVWPTSPLSTHFDAVSFSCVTGHRKPEPESYLTATRQLGVEPEECVFVGDGGSHELTGAADLGMDVYRFRADTRIVGDVVDQERAWSGPTLTDMASLVALATKATPR